jgi:hypothetical protein
MSLAKLETAFRSSLSLPPSHDVRGLAYRALPQWDSVAHMQLISEIESTFDVMFDADDVIDLSSFEKAVEILAKYGVECHA